MENPLDSLLEGLTREELSELETSLIGLNQVDDQNIDLRSTSKWLENLVTNASSLTPRAQEIQISKVVEKSKANLRGWSSIIWGQERNLLR
jgi:hypothetical protein